MGHLTELFENEQGGCSKTNSGNNSLVFPYSLLEKGHFSTRASFPHNGTTLSPSTSDLLFELPDT